jgi:uncharacterized membrane protein YGL010W
VKSLEENLTQYAAYHRDRRNVLTHFAGVPMIVFAIVLALATVSLPIGGIAVTLAAVVSIAAVVYWVVLDRALGFTMAVVLFLMCAASSEIVARAGVGGALAWALAGFVVGWALQFLGHKFEGMKPAFFDDVMQLIIGPLFVCAEVFFLLGARPNLKRYIEERVGPTVANRTKAPEGGEVPHS